METIRIWTSGTLGLRFQYSPVYFFKNEWIVIKGLTSFRELWIASIIEFENIADIKDGATTLARELPSTGHKSTVRNRLVNDAKNQMHGYRAR